MGHHVGMAWRREQADSQRIPFPLLHWAVVFAFTYYTGFKVNSGEYKVSGLAPVWRTEVCESHLRTSTSI